MLKQFIQSRYCHVPGQFASFKEFVSEFGSFLIEQGGDPAEWHPSRIANELESLGFVVGHSGGKIVGNLVRRDRLKQYAKVPGDKRNRVKIQK